MKTILFCSLGLAVLTAIAALAHNSMPTHLATEQSYPVNPVNAIWVQQSVQQRSHSTQSGNLSQQQTTLNLHSANLKHPYVLSVSTSGTQIRGQIVLDGKVLQLLRGDRQQINLSPYLTVGEHTVEISAIYAPASSAIRVEFSGVGTSMGQQTSGSGRLSHILVIQVD
jgi:hypothetical protein